MYKKVSILLLILILITNACKKSDTDVPDDVIARVGDCYITHRDVNRILSNGASYGNDSIKFARSIVDAWVERQLLSLVAAKNIPNIDEIEEKVNEYRYSLIIHEYIKHMIAGNKNVVDLISSDSIRNFYNNNKSQFCLNYPIVKGILLRVENTEPELGSLKNWIKQGTSSAIEHIEKRSLKNTIYYQYFQDTWADWTKIASFLPAFANKLDFRSIKNNYIEFSDNNYTYMLKISEFLEKGEIMPFDFAVASIRDMFVMANQQKYEKELRKSLITEALDDNTLQFYDSTMIKNYK